jgi:hypothetical protein
MEPGYRMAVSVGTCPSPQVAMTGHHDPTRQAASARPVLLARSRLGPAGLATHLVHVIPLGAELAENLGALCGAQLGADQIETVTPGEGVPCTLCLVIHVSESPAPPPTTPPPDNSEPGLLAALTGYLSWGWPVTLRRDQIWLSLDERAVALIIPTALATDVVTILATRRCPAPVLAHPKRCISVARSTFSVPCIPSDK